MNALVSRCAARAASPLAVRTIARALATSSKSARRTQASKRATKKDGDTRNTQLSVEHRPLLAARAVGAEQAVETVARCQDLPASTLNAKPTTLAFAVMPPLPATVRTAKGDVQLAWDGSCSPGVIYAGTAPVSGLEAVALLGNHGRTELRERLSKLSAATGDGVRADVAVVAERDMRHHCQRNALLWAVEYGETGGAQIHGVDIGDAEHLHEVEAWLVDRQEGSVAPGVVLGREIYDATTDQADFAQARAALDCIPITIDATPTRLTLREQLDLKVTPPAALALSGPFAGVAAWGASFTVMSLTAGFSFMWGNVDLMAPDAIEAAARDLGTAGLTAGLLNAGKIRRMRRQAVLRQAAQREAKERHIAQNLWLKNNIFLITGAFNDLFHHPNCPIGPKLAYLAEPDASAAS